MSDSKYMYILLREHNDYDQHEPGYFVGVFESYDLARESVDHLGRKNYEDCWYSILKTQVNINNDKDTTASGDGDE